MTFVNFNEMNKLVLRLKISLVIFCSRNKLVAMITNIEKDFLFILRYKKFLLIIYVA